MSHSTLPADSESGECDAHAETIPTWYCRTVFIVMAASVSAYFALSVSVRVHLDFVLESIQKVVKALT